MTKLEEFIKQTQEDLTSADTLTRWLENQPTDWGYIVRMGDGDHEELADHLALTLNTQFKLRVNAIIDKLEQAVEVLEMISVNFDSKPYPSDYAYFDCGKKAREFLDGGGMGNE